MCQHKTPVFVYGTLRSHQANYGFLRKAEPVAAQCWAAGTLYDTGFGYPAMVPGEGGRVYGEMYLVNEKQLRQLDDLEGYEGEGGDNEYERIRLTVHTDKGSWKAFAYVYSPERVQEEKRIDFGDWKCHVLLARPSFLYFAYGSCMDDERIRNAGMGEAFQEVVGRGVLRGYSLCFTQKAADGGRADIVEVGGYVEGKVYRIRRDALEYLFQREGVYAQVYRPTFVDVEVNGRKETDVLTFTVRDKQEETAPPEWYAREILRGAKGTVSEAYLRRLKEEWKKKFAFSLDGLI
ncbi:gamma-glutamylcyclotransferase [Bacillaceae bacterium]